MGETTQRPGMGPTGELGLLEARGAVFQGPAGGWSVSSTGCSRAGGSRASGRALGVGLALGWGRNALTPAGLRGRPPSHGASLHLPPSVPLRPQSGGFGETEGSAPGVQHSQLPVGPASAPLLLQLVTRGDKDALRVQRGRPCAPRGPEKASPSLAAPHRRPPCTKAGRPASSGGCHAVTQPPADPG